MTGPRRRLSDIHDPASPSSGPSLETYLETRFNLMREYIHEHWAAVDIRYQQRFEASKEALAAAFASQQAAMSIAFTSAEKAVQAALAAAERAVLKAEAATDKRFESVNEFRQTLTDQANTFMSKAEASALIVALSDKIADQKLVTDRLEAERAGIKGGWGYAAAVVGLVLGIGGVIAMVYEAVTP